MGTPLCMVLDLDDTLFLERDYVRSGFGVVGDWVKERFQIGDFAERAYRYFEHGRRGDIFDAVLKEADCDASTTDITSMVDVYREHFPAISLLPDAADFLAFCHGRFTLALISDGPLNSQRKKLEALGIENLFSLVVLTGQWLGCSKPNPRAFRLIEDRLGSAGMQFCYVADNPAKDFQAPLELGWKAIRVRRELGLYSSSEAGSSLAPHGEVPDLWVLREILHVESKTLTTE